MVAGRLKNIFHHHHSVGHGFQCLRLTTRLGVGHFRDEIGKSNHGHTIHHGMFRNKSRFAIVRDHELNGLVKPSIGSRMQSTGPKQVPAFLSGDGSFIVQGYQQSTTLQSFHGLFHIQSTDSQQGFSGVCPSGTILTRQQSQLGTGRWNNNGTIRQQNTLSQEFF